MADAFGVLLVFIAAGACILALFVVMGALFPSFVDRTREAASLRAGRSFLLGLLNSVFFGALVVILAGIAARTAIPAVMVVAVILLALLVICLTFGLAGMAGLVGARLFPHAAPLRQQLLGGLALILACATPYVGWFGLLPYTGMRGMGGFLLGWFSGRAAPQAAGPG